MKNIFLKLLLPSLLFLFCRPQAKAQADSVVIYDLAVMVSPVSNTNAPTAPQELRLSAYFKVNLPGNLSKVYVKIGLNRNTAEFITDTLTIVNHGAVHCMHSENREINPFWDLSTCYSAMIPAKSLANVKWITVYAKDLHGNFSAKKYFNIQ